MRSTAQDMKWMVYSVKIKCKWHNIKCTIKIKR